MDLVLKDLLPEQIAAFKKMADLLKIKTSQAEQILTEEEEDIAMAISIEDGMKTELLTDTEKKEFLNSL